VFGATTLYVVHHLVVNISSWPFFHFKLKNIFVLKNDNNSEHILLGWFLQNFLLNCLCYTLELVMYYFNIAFAALLIDSSICAVICRIISHIYLSKKVFVL
jgi:hypothetical protein